MNNLSQFEELNFNDLNGVNGGNIFSDMDRYFTATRVATAIGVLWVGYQLGSKCGKKKW